MKREGERDLCHPPSISDGGQMQLASAVHAKFFLSTDVVKSHQYLVIRKGNTYEIHA